MQENPLFPTILLVEDDQDMLNSLSSALEYDGYTVLVARTPSKAEDLILNGIYHLAIVDVRLVASSFSRDNSGLALVERIKQWNPHVRVIVHTAYADKENIHRGYAAGADLVLDKQDPATPTVLVQDVQDFFQTGIRCNFDLELAGDSLPNTIAPAIEVPPDALCKPQPLDIWDILSRMFHDAVRLDLHPLLIQPITEPQQTGSVLILVRPEYPQGIGAARVLKFSWRADIRTESRQYQEIRRFLQGGYHAALDEEENSRSVGALCYSLLGGNSLESLQTFGDLFHTQQVHVDELIAALRHHFFGSFASVYRGHTSRKLDIVAHYAATLGLTPAKVIRGAARVFPDVRTAETLPPAWTEPPRTLPNPILWLVANHALRSHHDYYRFSYTHGDLHSRNLLIDAGRQAWLVDFARSMNSHAFRDFAELESDIKFNLIPRDVDFNQLICMEDALCVQLVQMKAVAHDKEFVPPAFTDSRIARAFRLVVELRRIAMMNETRSAAGEYCMALLIHTLNAVRLKHIALPMRKYALIAAAMLLDAGACTEQTGEPVPRG